MTTAMEQAIAALAPFAKQAASLPSHDDHVTVFGAALGDCRAAARALAALRADPLRRASAARQERAQEEMEMSEADWAYLIKLLGPTSLAAFARRDIDRLLAKLAAAEHERDGYVYHLRECEQIAGKALGYPWFKDDQKNFPGTTEADGVCIGDHVGDTVVAELASRLTAANERLAYSQREYQDKASPAEIEAMAKRLDEQAIAQHSYSSGTEPIEAYLGSQAAALLRKFLPK